MLLLCNTGTPNTARWQLRPRTEPLKDVYRWPSVLLTGTEMQFHALRDQVRQERYGHSDLQMHHLFILESEILLFTSFPFTLASVSHTVLKGHS